MFKKNGPLLPSEDQWKHTLVSLDREAKSFVNLIFAEKNGPKFGEKNMVPFRFLRETRQERVEKTLKNPNLTSKLQAQAMEEELRQMPARPQRAWFFRGPGEPKGESWIRLSFHVIPSF